MPWSSLANNQTVSFSNLQNAVNNGVFSLKATIPSPSSTEQITKSDANTYVYINPNKASFSAKSNNQLVVKQDLEAVWVYCLGYSASSQSDACKDFEAYCGCTIC